MKKWVFRIFLDIWALNGDFKGYLRDFSGILQNQRILPAAYPVATSVGSDRGGSMGGKGGLPIWVVVYAAGVASRGKRENGYRFVESVSGRYRKDSRRILFSAQNFCVFLNVGCSSSLSMRWISRTMRVNLLRGWSGFSTWP